MSEFVHSFFTSLSQTLGGMFGSGLAFVVQIILYLLVAYLVWGVIWDRILTKAGFKGKAFVWRFCLLCTPMLMFPLESVLSRTAYQNLAAITGGCIWIGLYSIALFPWQVQPKPEQSPKTDTKQTHSKKTQV